MSKTTKCKDCGGTVSKRAKKCPHCGSPQRPQNTGCAWIVLIAFAAGIYGVWKISTIEPVSDPAATQQRDRYATEVPTQMLDGIRQMEEVAWVKRESNNVYVGLYRVPDDIVGLGNAWAIQLNKEWGFGSHLWFVPASATPGSVDKVYASMTAREGAIQ